MVYYVRNLGNFIGTNWFVMNTEKLKEYLHQIADNVNKDTRLDDIYDQLALLADIDESEEEEKAGKVIAQEEVILRAKEWLK
jgi:hypothetical protein